MAELSTPTRAGVTSSSRLEALLPAVAGDCDSRAEDIRGCADAMLSRLDDAPVRSHAVTLALRQTRECRRREDCDPDAVG